MNLHVTNDSYGLYTVEIAERIKNPVYKKDNIMVNILENVEIKDEIVEYIPSNNQSFEIFISKLQQINKVIFHPYTFTSYEFLKLLLKRFPHVKVYWICWSGEFYNLPHVVEKLYEPFSLKYIRSTLSLPGHIKQSLIKHILNIRGWAGIKNNYRQNLKIMYTNVDFFCSPLPTDFYYLNKIIPKNNIQYEPFAYLSLNKIMNGVNDFTSTGNKVMIGHSASADGNHFEIIQKLSSINKDFPVFLPLVYGDKNYGNQIKEIAKSSFKNVEVLEMKLDKLKYYKKLTEVGWAIINVKVQQGMGNIIALIWMGAKVFLDKKSSIYIDFTSWGITIYSVQDDLCLQQLQTGLSGEQIENNRKIMLDKFGEKTVSGYWHKIIS